MKPATLAQPTVVKRICGFQAARPGADWFDARGRGPQIGSVAVGSSLVPRLEGEFWTSGQRQGHSLHEVSYRGCFKAELPRFFIERLSAPGAAVYDPFMGRGTTLLEAALLGRRALGNDANPLSRILVAPRLRPPTIEAVRERLGQIHWQEGAGADRDLSMFYSRRTESQIVSLRDHLAARRDGGREDGVDLWIRMVATNRLTGHSPGFFSVYTLPPNQAVSAEAQRKLNARKNLTPPDRDVRQIIIKKSQALLKDLTGAQRDALRAAGEQARYFAGDAARTPELASASVDLVVTSPPFLDIVQYKQDNWLRCWFNGIDAEEVGGRITMARTTAAWAEAMGRVLGELTRVLKPGGWLAFEVGEVRKGTVKLDEVIAPVGVEAGLACRAIVINRQFFTKTSNCWGVANNRGGTNTNRIVLFQKGKAA